MVWSSLVWLENCREENYYVRPTKQCKNAADGGPGIYGDGIFSRVIQGILISTRLDTKTTSGKMPN